VAYFPGVGPFKTFRYSTGPGTATIGAGGNAYIDPRVVYAGPVDLDPAQGPLVFYPLGGQLKLVGFVAGDSWFATLELIDNTAAVQEFVGAPDLAGIWPAYYTSQINAQIDFGVQPAVLPLSLQMHIADTGGGGTFSWQAMTGYLTMLAP